MQHLGLKITFIYEPAHYVIDYSIKWLNEKKLKFYERPTRIRYLLSGGWYFLAYGTPMYFLACSTNFNLNASFLSPFKES